MAAAAPRAAVTAQVEDVGRVAGGAQPLADVTPRARVIGRAVQRQDGGPRRGGFVHVVDQQGAVGCGERGHLGLREQSAQQVQARLRGAAADVVAIARKHAREGARGRMQDRKSTRLNSSHSQISYAVFCLKKKNTHIDSSHSQLTYTIYRLKQTRT